MFVKQKERDQRSRSSDRDTQLYRITAPPAAGDGLVSVAKHTLQVRTNTLSYFIYLWNNLN